MKKLTARAKVSIIVFIIIILLIGMVMVIGFTKFDSDKILYWTDGSIRRVEWSVFHILLQYFVIICAVIFTIFLVYDGMEDGKKGLLRHLYKNENETNYNETDNAKTKFRMKKKYIIWAIVIIAAILIFKGVSAIYTGTIFVYNNAKIYQYSYTQKEQERVTFYDKMWKTYLSKDTIAKINRETFMAATKLIMDNRADSKTLTWKWLQENQQIDYAEFTQFYADLSTFITDQRKAYLKLETECQGIAMSNNILLDTFPNNLYNKLLGCAKIEYEAGFTSDSTQHVFATKKENLK
jgi:hypothetical protein